MYKRAARKEFMLCGSETVAQWQREESELNETDINMLSFSLGGSGMETLLE